MPERNENYMSNIKRLCGFCINEWHLTTMILPYISKEIENNYKMIMSGKLDPWDCLLEVINSVRYEILSMEFNSF